MIKRLGILVDVIIILWIIEYVDQAYLGERLDNFGLRPGEFDPWQIALMALLHGGFDHLLGNTQGLILFGCLMLKRGWSDLIYATLSSIVAGGLLINLIGQANSIHIGASGVVFGWWSFLAVRGYYERNLSAVACSLIILFFYGGVIYGVLPGQDGISWEGHLGGALGGVLAARLAPQDCRGRAFRRLPSLSAVLKAVGSLAVGVVYTLLPLDLVLDAIPVFGYSDDMGVNAMTTVYACWSLLKRERKPSQAKTTNVSSDSSTPTCSTHLYEAEIERLKKCKLL